MAYAAVLVPVGLGLLYLGGTRLVNGAATVARRLGVTPLAIGLTVVAYGTSAPELAVSMSAALTGHADVAVGNAVGSNILNIAVILGLAALVQPLAIRGAVLRREVPVLLLVMGMFTLLALDGELSQFDGALLLWGLALAIAYAYMAGRDESSEDVESERGRAPPPPRRRLPIALAEVGGGVVLLVLGAQALVVGAVEIAEAAGLSTRVIGLTIVAFGTSLPELATSVVAARRKESDLAVGNIIGSSVFNLAGILGASALATPLPFAAPFLRDLAVMAGVTALTALFMRTKFVLARWEAVALLAGYGGYLAWLLAGA